MSRNTWTVEILESNNVYSSDGTIYRPNEDLEIQLNSTHNKIILADGSFAFVTPENKSNKGQLTFVWYNIDDSDGIISKIENYIDNGDIIRITTHLSHTYTGKFIYLTKTHLTGIEDTFDIQTQFDQL